MFPVTRRYQDERGVIVLGIAQAGDAQLHIKLISGALFESTVGSIRDIMLTASYSIKGHPEYEALIADAIASIDFRQVEKELFDLHKEALLDARYAANRQIAMGQDRLQKIDAELSMSNELNFKGLLMQAVARIQGVLTWLTN